MISFQIRPLAHPLIGKIFPPPDKSITHRALILSAISKGKTKIRNFAFNDDCLATLYAFRSLGVRIKIYQSRIFIYGKGLKGLTRPLKAISAGESGTTMRLLLGVLAGQVFRTRLIAEKSLSRRPMLRVIAPLRRMGAKIKSKVKTQKSRREEYPPITIKGGNLKAITYKMPVASAQVKSALLLAGLYCAGTTRIIEPIKTRDHTERMLKLFGAAIKKKANTVSIRGGVELISPSLIDIPGDISCASFFLVAAAIIPGSHLVLKSVGLNPTRIGFSRVLKRMGADIKIQKSPTKAGSRKMREKIKNQNYEPRGDLIVKGSLLKATTVKKDEIPSLIDELPILMVAACQAEGRTVFAGIEELRLKETDRINSMMQNLRKMGAKIQLIQRNSRLVMRITGAKPLIGTKVSSFGDHRTAMSMVIAGLVASGQTRVDDVGCIKKSFPDFLKVLGSLRD